MKQFIPSKINLNLGKSHQEILHTLSFKILTLNTIYFIYDILSYYFHHLNLLEHDVICHL